MSAGPTGQLCRDLVGGSLTIKGRLVLDDHNNLKARGGIINGTLTVNEDVTVCGNVIVRDVVQSGAKAPVLLTGNTYTIATDDTTLIIPNIADTTVSLGFPDASACPGQELNINSENNFVYSTQNNILHLYDFNTTTNEVMGNLDTFAILQSDGENWIRIFNKLPNFG